MFHNFATETSVMLLPAQDAGMQLNPFHAAAINQPITTFLTTGAESQ